MVCNTNNDLDWHIDKDELEGRRSGRLLLPLLSTVFYPHVSCAGVELLVADSPPIENGYQGPLPTFRSVISIPLVVNRLVLFSPGILHRINPFEGERYSVAVKHLGAIAPHHNGCRATGLNFSIETVQARGEKACNAALNVAVSPVFNQSALSLGTSSGSRSIGSSTSSRLSAPAARCSTP